MYEFLVTSISSAIVKGDDKTSANAVKILRRRFKPGTQLNKELRLVNSLRRAKISSDAVAGNALREAREQAKSIDVAALDREKTALIHDVNAVLCDNDFYDRQVEDYRLLATLQTLINDWRSPVPDLGRIALYEDQVVRHMLTEGRPQVEVPVSTMSPGTSRLLMKTLTQRLNERYSSALNSDQRSVLKAYALSNASADPTTITMKLESIRDDVVKKIDAYVKANPNETYVLEKLASAKAKLIEESTDVPNDDLVSRFMLYSQLASEMTSEDV